MPAPIFLYIRTLPYLYETLVTPIYGNGWIYYARYSLYVVIPMYIAFYKGFCRQKLTRAVMYLKQGTFLAIFELVFLGEYSSVPIWA